MSTPVEQQLREYFEMVDRMQRAVDIDAVQQAPAAPTLRLIHTDDYQEEAMLAPDKDQRKSHSRRWLAAVAAVAVLVLVGGLIVTANRDADNQPAEQPEVPVPDTIAGVDGETAPLPEVDRALVGARTGGSVIFPETGNGGYDVSVYDWDLALSDDLAAVSGTATITATATQDLQQFSFDARGLQIESLTVDGSPAEYALSGSKLIIATSEPIRTGTEFVVGVTYDAEPVENPAPLTGSNGWKVVPGEQMLLGGWGAAGGWTPIDEDWITPRSRYIMRLDVPDGFTVTAGGVPIEDEASGDIVWDSGIEVRMPAFAVARFDTNVIDWDVPVEVSVEQGLGDREQFETTVADALTFLESQYGPVRTSRHLRPDQPGPLQSAPLEHADAARDGGLRVRCAVDPRARLAVGRDGRRGCRRA